MALKYKQTQDELGEIVVPCKYEIGTTDYMVGQNMT